MGITWAYPPPAAPPAQGSTWSRQSHQLWKKPTIFKKHTKWNIQQWWHTFGILISIRRSVMHPNKHDFLNLAGFFFQQVLKREFLLWNESLHMMGGAGFGCVRATPLLLPRFRTQSCTCSCWVERQSSHKQALLLNETFTPLPEHSFPTTSHGTGKGICCCLCTSWVKVLKHSQASVLAEKHQAPGAFQLKPNLLT